ncbi:MAG: glycoside hydrolase family 2 [Muribaculaceae bacterium]|nr:glycoside hydrolase family 2 [Muribaculaceae bacterium]
MKKFLLFLLVLISFEMKAGNEIDLSGKWNIALDKTDIGVSEGWYNKEFKQAITLPGTTDMAHLGDKDTLSIKLAKPQLLHLTRKYSYVGSAWYTKMFTAPKDMAGKRFILSLERTIWESEVWVDGKKVNDSCFSLSTPHRYDITDMIKPGENQRLTIRIDNRKKFETSFENLASSYTDATQTIWNGIIGEIKILAEEKVSIENLQVFPNIDDSTVTVKINVANPCKIKANGEICVEIRQKGSENIIASNVQNIGVNGAKDYIQLNLDMGDNVKLWDEFSPELYVATAKLKVNNETSEKVTDFGMRKISADGKTLLINGRPLFLRGTLECCVFPLTGCPPMNKEDWTKELKIAKEWGLNHLRFHSWCPPEAAFEAADEAGFYLQIELPLWTLTLSDDKPTNRFLYDEADRIMKEYGNHPSFCLWSMGNELQHDMTFMAGLVGHLKAQDNRHLYTNTTFTFEKGYGTQPIPNDDYFVTQWTKWGWVRGQGVFDSESPTFNKDYSAAVDSVDVPLITHEVGQYAVFPDLREIDKYNGVLDPINFKAIRKDLKEKGLLDKAADFTLASGKLASILYKEEVERALKTRGISGFQLLDLHDFPGQGTALVGLLNAFWESKGIVTPEYFREFCSPVTLLARFPKATYTNNEQFTAQIDATDYSGKNFNGNEVIWKIVNENGEIINSGKSRANITAGYNNNVINVNCYLQSEKCAEKLQLRVELAGTPYKNHWNIWVYPNDEKIRRGNVLVTSDYDEAMNCLKKGGKVLFNPDWQKINGIKGRFVPVFWSPVHFPKQAGTMGILCNPKHKALSEFPTDMNTDWQWWDLLKNSKAIDVSKFEGGKPIVEVIDNFSNNRKLAVLYECSVGKGKLIISSCDLTTKIDERIVAKQLLNSILDYMNSKDFTPQSAKNSAVLYSILHNN